MARCTGSAMLSSLAAGALGLGHPVWAVVSALVVSQDTAVDTRQAFVWRVAATAIGLLVAVVVGSVIPDPAPNRSLQLAIAVTVCAVIARRWPGLRVSMWTAPIVLMTTIPENGVLRAAVERGSEVLLGAMIATVLHLALDRALHIRGATRQNLPST
nr:FUSC family protein [Sphingomonas endophytica]